MTDAVGIDARIADVARQWIGTPYCHRASQRSVGTDCLGLLRGVWREVHGPEPEALPPYSRRWDKSAAGEPMLAAASRHLMPVDPHRIVPGAVLFFRMVRSGPVKHCGISVSEGRFVHAYEGRRVAESWFSVYWRRRLDAVFVFPRTVELPK